MAGAKASVNAVAKVFIDGQAGTVGLRIRALLRGRGDLDVVEVEEARRKDAGARRASFEAADVAVLCLPDEAVSEAVEMAAAADCRVLDASSKHRVSEGWVYGLPEIAAGQREAIAGAARVSNPGCYPTAVVLLLRPLVEAGLVARDAPIAVHALSGYSGGGRAKIERWEAAANGLGGLAFEAPYALSTRHKHAPEMTAHAGLADEVQFVPAVGPFRQGMRVEIPLPAGVLAGRATARGLWDALEARYRGERFVEVAAWAQAPEIDEHSFDPTALDGTNRIRLHVIGHASGHALLVAILDNLGKGAAGAAVQNLNLMLRLDEACGLV